MCRCILFLCDTFNCYMHVTSKSDAAMDEADATLFRSGRMARPAGCRAVAALMTAGAPRLTPPSPSAISLASSASRGAAARGLGVNVPGVPYARRRGTRSTPRAPTGPDREADGGMGRPRAQAPNHHRASEGVPRPGGRGRPDPENDLDTAGSGWTRAPVGDGCWTVL